MPIMPPGRPRVVPPASSEPSGDAIPFAPGDEAIIPPSTMPTNLDALPTTLDTDTPITLEELRRLDPSIQDLQIISIEDAGVGTPIR
jgi:hypothetical protein